MTGRRALLVMLLPVSLLSCQKPGFLLVGAELSELGPVIQRTVAADPAAGHWVVQPDTSPVAAGATAVRLTTTPGWNFPASGPVTVPVPDSWREGRPYLIPRAIERAAHGKGDSWDAVPLFFDVWGQSRPRGGARGGGEMPGWAQLVSHSPPRTVAMAGARPAFRQWALMGAVADPAVKLTGASGWFTQSAQQWTTELSSLRALKKANIWAPNAWFFSANDLRQSYKADSPLVVLLTFRDYESWGWSGVRTFSPLPVSGPAGALVGGPVVFAEVRGGPQSWKGAAPLLRLLAGPAFQREVEANTKWLPANLEAPELDETGAAARYVVRQATAFAPLTDRLPDPLVEGNLFVQAQLTVDRAPGG